ncbi:dihydrofolate reductase [Candidatus Woesearchaeota archaeon]|nr:dihydrofolate reductase [Candidatus Woesearchaeota archaeon]
METIIIAAVARNNVIGKNNKLPWHYKEDFQHFKRLTLNHVVVMGRKTFESIGKPLPNRVNLVVSRNKELQIPGCVVVGSLQETKEYAEAKVNAEKLFIIGGSSLFNEGLAVADAMELTLVHKDVEGDVYFPKWNVEEWEEKSREDRGEVSFVRFERMKTKTNAIVILYTDDNRILMQDRRNIKKWGEEWGFWGGGVEHGETKEVAAIREIKEELDYDLKEFQYIGQVIGVAKRFKLPHEQWHIVTEVFVTKISDDISQFIVNEGLAAQFFTIDEIKNIILTPDIDLKILKLFEEFVDIN